MNKILAPGRLAPFRTQVGMVRGRGAHAAGQYVDFGSLIGKQQSVGYHFFLKRTAIHLKPLQH